MNTSKRISWHAAAIAAAALMASSAAHAEHRNGDHRRGDRGYDNRGSDRNRGYQHDNRHDRNGGSHRRVWRDHGQRYYPHAYRGHRYPTVRYYEHRRAPRHYYGYNDYYYGGIVWPLDDFGASLSIAIPLR